LLKTFFQFLKKILGQPLMTNKHYQTKKRIVGENTNNGFQFQLPLIARALRHRQ